MFTAPEYASYIALCRELRLEREFEDGDWFVQLPDPHTYVYHLGWIGDRWITSEHESFKAEAVWLPRLDQWLAMLEEAGVRNVGFWRGDQWDASYAKCGTLLQVSPYEGWDLGDVETAPTQEEAAARLWCAVTGRAVPA